MGTTKLYLWINSFNCYFDLRNQKDIKMDDLKALSDFFQAIEKDFRISTTHIAVFAALIQFRKNNGVINPIEAYSFEIQKIAKITSPRTYYKCMIELHDYGYITYKPTKNRKKRSIIYFHFE